MSNSENDYTTPIRHSDTPFAVAMRVDLAPRHMQQRELQKNALESATNTQDCDALVEWRAIDYVCSDGTVVQKLSVFNTGPGMDDVELRKVMDLASSGGGKQNGLKENFGMGAKVTGLKNNPCGMRYRSCKAGVISEVIIGKRGDQYVMLRQKVGPGEYYEVIDVTEKCKSEGYPTKHDWTEVTLLGHDEKHDTVRNPYEPNGEIEQNWLVKSLNQRFWMTPDGVTVRLNKSVTGSDGKTRKLEGLSDLRKHAVRDEEVATGHGVTVRYSVLQRSKGGGGWHHYGLQPHICIVWRNECYDVVSDFNWRRLAPRYGIPYGAAQIAIQIHLDESVAVTPEQYRQFLQTDDGELHQVHCEDYARLIFDHRPEWFIDFVASQVPAAEEQSAHLAKRLKDLLRDYDWLMQMFKPDDDGDEDVADPTERGEGDEGGGGDEGSTSDARPGERKGSPSSKRKGKLPTYRWIKGGTMKNRGEMSQRASRYDIKLHEIVLNEDYEIIEHAVQNLVGQFPHVSAQHELRADALRAIREEFVFRAIKSVMMALVHRGDPHWSAANVEAALTEECLTVALDDTRDIVKSVKRGLAQKYGATTR